MSAIRTAHQGIWKNLISKGHTFALPATLPSPADMRERLMAGKTTVQSAGANISDALYGQMADSISNRVPGLHDTVNALQHHQPADLYVQFDAALRDHANSLPSVAGMERRPPLLRAQGNIFGWNTCCAINWAPVYVATVIFVAGIEVPVLWAYLVPTAISVVGAVGGC